MPTHIPVQSMTDDLAKSIRQIDAAVKSIASSGVKRETLVVLIKAHLGSRIAVADIRNVLTSLDKLADIYLEKPDAK